MDPRNRADETLARARARGAFVVTPDSATSPMDAAQTVRIPRDSVSGAEHEDPDPTGPVPDSAERGTQRPGEAWRERGERPTAEQPAVEQRNWPEHDADLPTAPHGIESQGYQHEPHHGPRRFD
ncbi:hypothetical protein CDG81_04150 [Actinopolyspora erythraea]|uniref:Uncharacterized protein n=1 Tax=Actinopolyspora erythraea TaxID=414996 RepID=A0A099D423_9ACTN|nr:hypothetical protein [Actinopolyspora erythraea]ASU77635.1 hypothetical protein CDG81_04150 [Actinopolyspora erythraea]KGI80527.1 hypothetical protein IL38_16790 [Actinopolyspora erythraea]